MWTVVIVVGSGFAALMAGRYAARPAQGIDTAAFEPVGSLGRRGAVARWMPSVAVVAACGCALVGCWREGTGLEAACLAIAAGFGVPAALADVLTGNLPGVLTDLAALGVLSAVVAGAVYEGRPGRLGVAVACAGGYAGALYLLALFTGQLGLGDVRLSLSLGMVTGLHGPPGTLTAAVSAFMLAAAVTVPLLASGLIGRRTRIPFGPFLLAGTTLAALVL